VDSELKSKKSYPGWMTNPDKETQQRNPLTAVIAIASESSASERGPGGSALLGIHDDT
jgi:hypothetical protein